MSGVCAVFCGTGGCVVVFFSSARLDVMGAILEKLFIDPSEFAVWPIPKLLFLLAVYGFVRTLTQSAHSMIPAALVFNVATCALSSSQVHSLQGIKLDQ
jgi:hypothetical protein